MAPTSRILKVVAVFHVLSIPASHAFLAPHPYYHAAAQVGSISSGHCRETIPFNSALKSLSSALRCGNGNTQCNHDIGTPARHHATSLDENTNIENSPMTRFSFLSHSISTVAAVSLMAANPKEAEATAEIRASSSLVAAKRAETTQETISGFVSGAAITTTKTIVKYPLDTATVRLQVPNTLYSISNLPQLFEGSYRGMSLPLLSNIPGGAIFFAIKDATKSVLKESGMPRWMSTCIAVGVAQPPYWLIRNPSEVVKTRQQAKIEGYASSTTADEGGKDVSAIDAFRLALDSSEGGIKGLYSGYWENILYAYPADVLKFVAYETLSGGRKNIPPAEGAVYGALATAMAQFWTTPLDVVRNRIMADVKKKDDESDGKTESYTDNFVRLAQDEGLSGLFAGAVPRVGKAFLSGAIQFATYEETKKSIGKLFSK